MFRSRTACVFGHGRMLFRGAVEALPLKSALRTSGIVLLSGVRYQSSHQFFAPQKVGVVKTFGREPQHNSTKGNITSLSVSREFIEHRAYALLGGTAH